MRKSVLLAAIALGGVGIAAAAAPAPSAAPTAHSAATHTVRFGEYFYRPKRLTVRAGDRVRFLNVGKFEHTVADSTRRGGIRSRIIKPRPLARGKSQTVTFERRGTVHYVCTFHPSLMRGVVVVR